MTSAPGPSSEFQVHWGSETTLFKPLQTENNLKLFERDLGEGRKLVPEPDQVKDDKSRLPAPLPFRKAERATPDMKVHNTLSCILIVAEELHKVGAK